MKPFPNKQTAQQLFEKVIVLRNSSNCPFVDNQEYTFRKHCFGVAFAAEKIAEAVGLDKTKAYVFGLLHDAGRILDEKTNAVFHAYTGYKFLNELGYPEIARISLTHSFYDKNIDESLYMKIPDIQECKKLLSNMKYDDYDHLIQLCDQMNNLGEFCTIEERFADVSRRYARPAEKLIPYIKIVNNIKADFDIRAGQNVYKLLGIR